MVNLNDSSWYCIKIEFGGFHIARDGIRLDETKDFDAEIKNAIKQNLKISKCINLIREKNYTPLYMRKDKITFSPVLATFKRVKLDPDVFTKAKLSESTLYLNNSLVLLDGDLLFIIRVFYSKDKGSTRKNFNENFMFSACIRDLVENIFRKNLKTKIVPPNIGRSAIFIVNKKGQKYDIDRFGFRKSRDISYNYENLTIKQAIELFHASFARDLGLLYDAYEQTQKLDTNFIRLRQIQEDLLKDLESFLKINAFDIFSHHNISKRIKTKIVNTMTIVLENDISIARLEEQKYFIRRHIIENNKLLSKQLFERLDWQRELNSSFRMDFESVFRNLDQAKDEIQSYWLNQATLLSAIVGALVGVIVTVGLHFV